MIMTVTPTTIQNCMMLIKFIFKKEERNAHSSKPATLVIKWKIEQPHISTRELPDSPTKNIITISYACPFLLLKVIPYSSTSFFYSVFFNID